MENRKQKNKIFGFTLIELLVVIAIIAVLATIMYTRLVRPSEQAYFSRAAKEFDTMATALEFYLLDNGVWPPDANRDIPPGLEPYLAPGDWPDGPWPGSVYDWENWDDPETGDKIYQISIRFCPIGGPLAACNFPQQEWAADFDVQSSLYYCLQGVCRSHISKPIDHPGYCINCGT